MKYSRLELVVGTFVLAGLIAIAFFALRIGAGNLVRGETYPIKARFSNVGGINPGGTVAIAGVSVGRIERIELDDTYGAVVTMKIRKDVKLPLDTIASIRSSGIIGEKYLSLSPGADTDYLAPGNLIEDTESSVDLESLISRFAFGSVDESKKEEPKTDTK